jgi:hypothetical protein
MYICELCNKNFKMKIDYDRHLKRKTPCVKACIQCHKCNRNFKSLLYLRNHLNKKKSCDNNEIYKCSHCNKQYITKQNYHKHMLLHQTEITNKDITNTDNKINIQNNNSNNSNSNNNITMINHYNISINKFGSEDRSYLTEDKICSILNKGFNAMPELIKETHFNKDQPQNHNIYITNLSKKTILIYDGERWVLTSKDSIIDDLINDNEDFIITNYEELKVKLSIEAVNRLDRFIRELGNPKYLSKLHESLQLILYNYRDVVERTRNRTKDKYIK